MLTDEQIRKIGGDAFGIDIAFDGHLMRFARAVIAAAEPEIRKVARERIIVECVPGGSFCDPQQIADAIRSLPDAGQRRS